MKEAEVIKENGNSYSHKPCCTQRRDAGLERCMSLSDSLLAERRFSIEEKSHSLLQLTCKPMLFVPPPSRRLSSRSDLNLGIVPSVTVLVPQKKIPFE